MARKANQNVLPVMPEPNDEAISTGMAALEEVRTIDRVQEAALDVGRLAGRVESMVFLRQCADRVIAETFIQLREGKKYKELQFRDADGKLRACADLAEACERLLGRSYRVCAEIVQNYETLGSDLFEKASQLGLARNDYRALRAMSDDEQVLVQQAIESASDSESVAELISEIVERGAKKLADKDREIEDLKADREADARLLATRTDKMNEMERRLAKIELGAVPIAARIVPVMDEISEFSKRLDLEMRNLAIIFAAVEGIAGEEAEKPEGEADVHGVLPLVQRLRDAINRAVTAGTRLQFEFDGRLQHHIGSAEMFLAEGGVQGE